MKFSSSCNSPRKRIPGWGSFPADRGLEFAVGAKTKTTGNSDGAALEVWRALPSVESVREDDGHGGAECVKEPHLTIPALLDAVGKQGSELQHLITRQASLEDVFVRLTRRHLREE
jgi:hypothetical protein